MEKRCWGCALCFILFTLEPALFLNLNVQRALLPRNTGIGANISLQLGDFEIGECYEWKSSSPELLLVRPYYGENGNCYTKAIISVLSQSESQQEVLISVLKSGEAVLFCDVIIDAIHEISLHHTADKIYVGGPPETISVVAKNKDGNTFSTLDGVKFEWKVENLKEIESFNNKVITNIVSPVNISQSTYVHVDASNWKHSILMLEGSKSGVVSITASLEQDISDGIISANMIMKVSSSINIRPSGDVYSFVGASINFSVVTKYEQNLDSKFYKFTAANSSVAIFENGTILLPLNEGQTDVYAEDIYGNQLRATVYVVKPVSISLEILYANKWSLQEAKTYEMLVNLWDSSHHLIHPSKNINVQVAFPSKYFHINSSLPNGLRHTILTLVPGSGVISAKFLGVKRNVNTVPTFDLKTSQKFIIYQAIQVFPSVLLLPYHSASPSMYNIVLKATGGTGFYSWSTNNDKATKIISEVETSSIAVIHIHHVGDFVISASDKNSSVSAVSSKVSVQHVADIEVYPTVVEAEIGNEVFLPIGLLGYECKDKKVYRVFDDCRNVSIDVEIIEKHIVAYEPDSFGPSYGRGCLSIRFLCLNAGHSRINLSYKSEGDPLKTTVVIACHKPLKPIHPVRVAVFGLGTSKEIAFEGGPHPWPLFVKGHFLKLIPDKPGILNITIIKDPIRYNKELHVFNIACIAIGDVLLSLHVGNEGSPTNPNPAQLESSIKAVCSKPYSVHLAYKSQGKKKINNNLSGKTVVKIPFYGNKQFEIDLWVKDDIGRKFSNLSTFKVHWTVSDDSIAKPLHHEGLLEHVDGSESYRKVSRNFQQFQMTGKAGSIKVEAQLMGYEKSKLTAGGISDIDDFVKVTNSIELELVSLRDLYDDKQNNNILDEEHCHGDSCKS